MVARSTRRRSRRPRLSTCRTKCRTCHLPPSSRCRRSVARPLAWRTCSQPTRPATCLMRRRTMMARYCMPTANPLQATAPLLARRQTPLRCRAPPPLRSIPAKQHRVTAGRAPRPRCPRSMAVALRHCAMRALLRPTSAAVPARSSSLRSHIGCRAPSRLTMPRCRQLRVHLVCRGRQPRVKCRIRRRRAPASGQVCVRTLHACAAERVRANTHLLRPS